MPPLFGIPLNIKRFAITKQRPPNPFSNLCLNMEALVSLYPKLVSGGFCIVDDYALTGCKAAVDDFHRQQRIDSELIGID